MCNICLNSIRRQVKDQRNNSFTNTRLSRAIHIGFDIIAYMNPPADLLPLISSTIEKIKAKKKEMDAITSEMRLLLQKKPGEF